MAWARAKLFLAPALVTPREPDQASLFCGLHQGKTDKEGNPCLVDYLPYDIRGKPLKLSQHWEEQGSSKVAGWEPRIATGGTRGSKKTQGRHNCLVTYTSSRSLLASRFPGSF